MYRAWTRLISARGAAARIGLDWNDCRECRQISSEPECESEYLVYLHRGYYYKRWYRKE